MRKLLLFLAVVCIMVFFGGPVSSGALLLLLPTSAWSVEHGLPRDYQPRHRGGANLAMGRYMRENEDLVVHSTPALILKRTYLSGYNEPLPFGIGTTHSGEIWIRGDGERFQWAELILNDGTRVRFQRTSFGTSVANALYEHHAGQPEWEGARLGWTGIHWALRRTDGALFVFRPCTGRQVCSVIRAHDEDGHVTHYRRDRRGRLMAIESGDRRITFDYDGRDRIALARGSNGLEVRYEYDGGAPVAGDLE